LAILPNAPLPGSEFGLIYVCPQGENDGIMMTNEQTKRYGAACRAQPDLYETMIKAIGWADVVISIGIHGWTLDKLHTYFKSQGWDV
jgi:hypothetical protein